MEKRKFMIFLCISIILILSLSIVIAILIYPMNSSPEKILKRSIIQNLEISKNNGIVTNIWLYNKTKLDIFRKNNIKYLFIDVGDTRENGKLGTPKREIENFLKFIDSYEKENNYKFVLLPYSEVNSYNYDVSKSFLRNFVREHIYLNRIGFDGILVDIEPVRFELREDYINFIKDLRKKLPERAIISVYAGSIVDIDNDNEWEWSYSFYKQVSDNVDIISVQGYDFDFINNEDYKNYLREQINAIASKNWNSYFLMAVPTHKQPPETIENALSVYKEEIAKYPNSNFIGFVIFAEWTTDDEECKVIENF